MATNSKGVKKDLKEKANAVKDIDNVIEIHIVNDFDIADSTKPSKLLRDVVRALKNKEEREIALHALNNP